MLEDSRERLTWIGLFLVWDAIVVAVFSLIGNAL